jgi:hypothetical protein
MAETIPGGAYKGADGRWHDANGKPIGERAVEQARAKQTEKQAELQQAEENREEQAEEALIVSTETPAAEEVSAPKRRPRRS